MDAEKKRARYGRIRTQLEGILAKCGDPEARMASVVALLHHKMDHFFWTGFYGLRDGRLMVKLYQGPIACMELKRDTGVCWAAINSGQPVVVPDVAAFPGHIACDSRSKSEICVPFRDPAGAVTAVLDIDSDRLGTFDEVDAQALADILQLIHATPAAH
jgi:GAF domain-containing protein